jgi:hypothetical protein
VPTPKRLEVDHVNILKAFLFKHNTGLWENKFPELKQKQRDYIGALLDRACYVYYKDNGYGKASFGKLEVQAIMWAIGIVFTHLVKDDPAS